MSRFSTTAASDSPQLDPPRALHSLGTVYIATSQNTEAEPYLRRAADLYPQFLPPGSEQQLSALRGLSKSYVNQAKFAEAAGSLGELRDLLATTRGPQDRQTRQIDQMLRAAQDRIIQ